MAAEGVVNGDLRPPARPPVWLGYAVTTALVCAVTGALTLAHAHFLIGKFPLPYILLVMAVAYWFGGGPAALAGVIGLFAYTYNFSRPEHRLWPLASSPEQWAVFALYVTGTLVGGLVMRTIRKTEDAQRRSEERYHSLVQLLPLGVAEIGLDGCLTFVNPAFCSIHELPEDQLIGFPPWRLMESEGECRELEALIRRLLAEQPPPSLTISRARTGSGRAIDVQTAWNYRLDREGRVVGLTIVVADVTEETRTRKALEHSYEREHRIAETLQASLMRPVPRQINGFVFEKMYRAASEEARVGGDFYDVFQLDDERIGVVIGDVSGKGLNAAVQVASARYALRGRTYECGSPAEVMEQVNRTLVQDLDAESFITVFLGILDSSNNTLRYANAGHSPVMHWMAAESCAVLFGPTGSVAGMDREMTYSERTVQLETGDELLLGTDGLYEIRYGETFLGLELLLEIYSEAKLEGVKSTEELVGRVVERCTGGLRDDIAVLRISVGS